MISGTSTDTSNHVSPLYLGGGKGPSKTIQYAYHLYRVNVYWLYFVITSFILYARLGSLPFQLLFSNSEHAVCSAVFVVVLFFCLVSSGYSVELPL